MTSGECFENKWLYMKYIGEYLSAEILLTRDGVSVHCILLILWTIQRHLKLKLVCLGLTIFYPPK